MAREGRDSRGRFAPGNRAGRGNPTARRDHRHRAAIRAAVSPEDVADIVRGLAVMALAGDIDAARVVLERVLGRPRPEPEDALQFVFDPRKLDSAEAVADAVGQVVRAAADSDIPPDALPRFTALLDIALKAVAASAYSSPEQRAKQIEHHRALLRASMEQDPDDD